MKKFYRLINDKFSFQTSLLSFTLGLLYLLFYFFDFHFINNLIFMSYHFLYILIILFFGKKAHPFCMLGYSIYTLLTTAFINTFLFNNYTAFFIILLVSFLYPKLKKCSWVCYLIITTILFIFNNETICHYLLHIGKCIWFRFTFEYFFPLSFEKKKLFLTNDEILILNEMEECQLQKLVTCFSKNIVTKKLSDAKNRNQIEDSPKGTYELRTIFSNANIIKID